MCKHLTLILLISVLLLSACGGEEKDSDSSSGKLPDDVQAVFTTYVKDLDNNLSLQPLDHSVNRAEKAEHLDVISLTWAQPVDEAWCITIRPPIIMNRHDAGSYDRDLINFLVVRIRDTWSASYEDTPGKFEVLFRDAGCNNYQPAR